MALNATPGKATRSPGTGIFPFYLGDHYWLPGAAWGVPHPDSPSQSCPANISSEHGPLSQIHVVTLTAQMVLLSHARA